MMQGAGKRGGVEQGGDNGGRAGSEGCEWC